MWGFLMNQPTEWLHSLIPWIGKNILHLNYEITVFPNGSGDTTYNYFVALLIFSVSILTSIIWSLVDWNQQHYKTLYYWLTVAIRFYVALMLINYGIVKVFKLQFPSPGLSRLTQLYGDSSPMGLAWTFLGFSKGYNLFMGVAELSAILLLFRRTMTLGAIITLMTTANVMAINYFYDVPVKLISTHLFLMTLFLISHNAKDLWRFFFSSQHVKLSLIEAPKHTKPIIRIAGITIKLLLLAFVIVSNTIASIEMLKIYGDNFPSPTLNGVYQIEEFKINQKQLPLLANDTLRWNKLIIDLRRGSKVELINNERSENYHLKVDTTWHSIQFTYLLARDYRFDLSYETPDEKHLLLKGTLKTDSVYILLKRVKNINDFRLNNTRFNWINEYPYNR